MTLPYPNNFIAQSDELGHIALTGEDAANFLHNQITNDVERLTPEVARLAAYCSPKGRMLASFLLWRSADTIYLQLPKQIQPAIQKRLQMFVLRAKVKLADASPTMLTFGLLGHQVARAFAALPAAPYSVLHDADGTLIRLADADGLPRYQWITSPETAARRLPEIAVHLPQAGAETWRLSDIHAGIPQITLATQEQFVPQMINYELIGGVNFKKGCYPGQEIVARSQYLGKLKRRMLRGSVAGDAAAGMDVFSADDPDQPCGMVVNAEAGAAGQSELLIGLKLAAAEGGAVHLGSIKGNVIQFATLPYPLTDPE
jgi:hypothetical protein